MSELANDYPLSDHFDASDAVSPDSGSDVFDMDSPFAPDLANPPSRRELFRDAVAVGIAAALAPSLLSGGSASAQGVPPTASTPPLAPSPGSPRAWIESVGVYSGSVNLATGNLWLSLPLCGWGGLGGLSFGIVFNSQTSRTSSLGGKWTHSYRSFISGTSPAVAVDDDGTETLFALSGATYTAPVGVYESLVLNGNGTWTRTLKGGTVMTYLSSGSLDKITDRNGNITQLAYTSGLLTSVTDPVGRVLTLGYTSGLLTSVTDALGRVRTLSYDANNRVSSISEPLLSGVTFSRGIAYVSSTNANVASLTDRRGKTWGYAYGSANSIFASTTDPLTKTWSLAYYVDSASLKFARWTDPLTRYTDTAFDALGRSTKSANPLSQITLFGWDTANNRTSMTTPSGKVWGSTYDSRGNGLTSTNPLGKVTTTTYQNDFPDRKSVV